MACLDSLHLLTNQAAKSHEGKEIDIEHGPDLVLREILKIIIDGIACIVDQDINLAIVLIDFSTKAAKSAALLISIS